MARPEFGRGCSSGVEHDLAKVGVEGSNPFARSKIAIKKQELTRGGFQQARSSDLWGSAGEAFQNVWFPALASSNLVHSGFESPYIAIHCTQPPSAPPGALQFCFMLLNDFAGRHQLHCGSARRNAFKSSTTVAHPSCASRKLENRRRLPRLSCRL